MLARAGEFRRTSSRDDQPQNGESVVAHFRRGADTDLHADAARLVSALPQLADLQAIARQQPALAVSIIFVADGARARPAAAAAAAVVGAASSARVEHQLKENTLFSSSTIIYAFSLRHVRISLNLFYVYTVVFQVAGPIRGQIYSRRVNSSTAFFKTVFTSLSNPNFPS